MVEAAGRNFDEGCHRSVDSIPKAKTVRIQIVESLTDERRIGRQNRGCFADHAVTFLEAAHTATKFSNETGELMTEDDWIIHCPALRACVCSLLLTSVTWLVSPVLFGAG